MFEVKRPEEKPIIVIRTATPKELSNYEKWKLENIEEGAQVNKLETIRHQKQPGTLQEGRQLRHR